MSVRSKLAGFCLLLVVALCGGAALGAVAGPIDIGGDSAPDREPPAHQGH